MSSYKSILTKLEYSTIACFDLDYTLIKPKSGKKFPIDKNDWEWMYPNVPEKLKDYYEKKYTIVIFSNQKKLKNLDDFIYKIQMIETNLSIPINIFISLENDYYRKPHTGMFDKLLTLTNIDMTHSFYCGDAAGRNNDFSNSDRLFAHNCNLTFILPENCFLNHNFILPDLPIHPITDYISTKDKDFEIIQKINKYLGNSDNIAIINIGAPASGKSFFTNSLMSLNNTFHKFSNDEIKNKKKLLSSLKKSLETNRNVIIDNTNPDVITRKIFVDLCKEYNYKIIFCWFNLPLDISKFLNEYRTQIGKSHIPALVYNIYKKKFEIPSITEGIDKIIEIKNIFSLYHKNQMFKYLF
jgi:bifunctional polynucleotide phosphatase/kinase